MSDLVYPRLIAPEQCQSCYAARGKPHSMGCYAGQLERDLEAARISISEAHADAGNVAAMLLDNDREGALQWAKNISVDYKTAEAPRLYVDKRVEQYAERLQAVVVEHVIPILERLDTLRHIEPEFPALDALRMVLAKNPNPSGLGADNLVGDRGKANCGVSVATENESPFIGDLSGPVGLGPVESRSQLRRIAAMKGEPAPDFSDGALTVDQPGAEFAVWASDGEDTDFVAQVNGPRETALDEARRYALQAVAVGDTAIIEEVTRREVERLSPASVLTVQNGEKP